MSRETTFPGDAVARSDPSSRCEAPSMKYGALGVGPASIEQLVCLPCSSNDSDAIVGDQTAGRLIDGYPDGCIPGAVDGGRGPLIERYRPHSA